MAKHSLAEHSVSDDERQVSSAKRRRTASSLPRSTPPRDRDGDVDFDPDAQGEAGSGEDDEDEDEDEDMSDDEERRRQAALLEQTQRARPSKIAEAGVIKQVDLQSFMCHAHTTVDFGPQVNFLVGVNGSGKSAILTGITMALGGNAKATNRGHKGGDLIMEGKTSARCTVTLANKGEEAFQHHVYGDSITVERTLNKTGGGYKIKNHEGKVVDTKKATLDAILDTFNIQVDNPMTVLTQDQSRQFLASASPKDKYTFFLRGTQLAQLTEEYEQIRNNTETMEEALGRKQEVLPELKDAYRRAKDRAKDAKAAITQQGNLSGLKNQLAWSFVDEIERKIAFGEDVVAKERQNLVALETDIAGWDTKLETANTQISDLREVDKDVAARVDELRPQAQELESKIKGERDRLRKWKDFERQISQTVQRLKDTIADFDRQILAEETKLSRDIEAERRPLRDKIEQANADISELTERMQQSRRTAADTADRLVTIGQDYDDIKSQIDAARAAADEVRARIQYTRQSATNNVLAYGPKTPQFLQAINSDRGWRDKPIGPIGQYVKLDHQQYGGVLESFFAQILNAYICTNHEDSARLKRIHRQCQLDHNTPILVQTFDPAFEQDLARQQPDESILTVLRACTITHLLVMQALIVNVRIERAALVPTRPDGDTLMRTNPRNVDSAYSAEAFRISINQGRSATSTMPGWRGAPRLQKDVASTLNRLNDELAIVQRDLQRLEETKAAKRQEGQAAQAQKKQAEDESKRAQSRMLQLNNVIRDCTAKLEEEQPSNIAALQENKRETEEELDNATRQYTAGLEAHEREGVNSEVQAVVEAKHELEAKIKKNEKLLAQTAKALDKQIAEIQTCRSKIEQLTKSKSTVVAKIEKYSDEVVQAKAVRDERVELASAVCERPQVDKQKDPKRLQKEIDTLERALKERERRQGASIEQILEELEVRKKVAQDAVRQVNELALLVGALKNAYDTRVSRWTDFRSHIVARARAGFHMHLSNRGFQGELKFKHDACTLNILIRTEEGKKGKRKDTKSLSGGEKSFSTICLLLTMWESVGCPLRCLDEFDVFMDAVNRRIAMKMMIDTAKTAHQTQFILITPQEMSSIKWGEEVRVTKLEDPKRSQGALAHGR
ncbi:RecF/RecN/SMC [Rhodotorula diobovata]|uniref:RecF/RecN/SMC n=1 Tax=Rhodotorula diobovata TaxID=5288 RepID=A0A5C5G0N5_9BASI|nr:RecF/RecN/SMC [Rhodotorula diobovata]